MARVILARWLKLSEGSMPSDLNAFDDPDKGFRNRLIFRICVCEERNERYGSREGTRRGTLFLFQSKRVTFLAGTHGQDPKEAGCSDRERYRSSSVPACYF